MCALKDPLKKKPKTNEQTKIPDISYYECVLSKWLLCAHGIPQGDPSTKHWIQPQVNNQYFWNTMDIPASMPLL